MSVLECLSSASVETSAFPLQQLPEFAIGDRVASDCLDGISGEMITEFGEIVERRYLSERLSTYPAGSWIYFVNWLSSTCPADDCYPDYDGEPVGASYLRLVA